MTTSQYLHENEQRIAALFPDYDPVMGIGSHIERFPFYIYEEQEKPIYLPVSMKKDYKGVVLERDSGKNFQAEMIRFQSMRFRSDFEYWAHTCVKIKNKEGGKLIPFKIRLAQRILLDDLMDMFLAGVPIRIILVKARQWGGSTLIQMFMVWIQFFHKTHWNSVIVGDVEDQARNVRAMYTRLIENYPAKYGSYNWLPFEGSTKNRIIPERDNIVSIGSMQKPESLRSNDISMAHLTEVGLWKKTEGKSPEDLIQNIRGTIPNYPLSLLALESTAKGVGNYFHRTWMEAKRGESDLRPVFIPWYKIEMYWKPFDTPADRIKFLEHLSDYEKWLWDQGATIEGIHWYRDKLKEYAGDEWRMKSEFPTTSEEAFQNTGKKVFPPSYVASLKENLRPPILRGEIFAASRTGKDAFKDLRIEATPNGNLSVWAMPNTPAIPSDMVAKGGRYALFVDVGGKSAGSDFSVISGFDRYWMAKGMTPERAFTWKGHIDPDLLAWKACQLGWIFEKALVAFEINSYNQDKNTEGEHSFTIIDTIADYYPNLFTRSSPEDIRQGLPTKYGFHTNKQTKGMIVDNYNMLLRMNHESGGGYVEYDEGCYFEADHYEFKENGSMGAVDGQHDDELITAMGGLWLCTSYMEPFTMIPQNTVVKKKQVLKSAASF